MIKIICVGKLKEKFWIDAVKEYSKRLSKYTKLEIIEIPDFKSDIASIELEKEKDKILSKINDKDLRFYGDSDLSKFNTFFKCSAGYFFVSYLGGPFDEGDVKIVSIYTTDWKKLGYIDLNNVKSDKSGIFIYEDYDDNYKLSGTAIKYDANGNKIN